MENPEPVRTSVLSAPIRFTLENKLVVFLVAALLAGAGVVVAPFDWKIPGLTRYPVPVDAIPDIGENQQIVFTEWPGRSPRDVEDQITYPLTAALLGLPEVKTIRGFSMFGFSSIHIIFNDKAEFYWSRSRVLEKLNSLPAGTLPEGVAPALGPNATALGQVFWYTLEGRDPDGNPAGGWDPRELRSIQDFQVRYALQAVEGVAEVASVGGFVREYQIDVDPDAMRQYGVTLDMVFSAVKNSNLDVGARTIEINKAEYVVRGVGFVKNLDDLRQTVVKSTENVPVTLDRIAQVTLGPAMRRGALDKDGAEATGGVVVVRHGANPLEVIGRVKDKIAEIGPGLPEKTLADGTRSKVALVPFYDRTGLIHETLGTLNTALFQEILITIVVVVAVVLHLRGSLLIALLLPVTVLLTFIAMKLFGVDANIVSLSGIAIAIGTIVDMGIVVCENILKHLDRADPGESRLEIVHRATVEVGGAVLTAVTTTVLSFLAVFAMEGPEGKLFRPLAFTKTFALVASIVVALALIPPLAHLLLGRGAGKALRRARFDRLPEAWRSRLPRVRSFAIAGVVLVLLAGDWMPLGPEKGIANHAFVVLLVTGLLACFGGFIRVYDRALAWILDRKAILLAGAAALVTLGFLAWLGVATVFAFVPDRLRDNALWSAATDTFPGLGREFMPPLDEGSFLFMPSLMPHASIGEATDVLSLQDRAIRAIPEVDSVVGKIGRADSPLDPAPVSMIETIVNYKPEYATDSEGRRHRQWRDEIRTPDDIWREILRVTELPGVTSAPRLQPIETRLVMLQTGMRAPMGLKVRGPDLESIERAGLEIERVLREVPAIEPASVFADRIVGKPYLEIDIDRRAIGRYGMTIQSVQDIIEVAIGGRRVTTTVEGRERYAVRVRYQRELRDTLESLGGILIPARDGTQVPLRQLAEIRYERGPQAIKSEDTFLTGYVIFDKKPGHAEVEVVRQAGMLLGDRLDSGALVLPAGVTYRFTGSHENQVRASEKLRLLVPVSLLLIFIVIYLQFKSVTTTALVFSGIFVAWSGGFLLLWLYGQDWFLDFGIAGVDPRSLFQIHPLNLSVAVWVGFLALFGIATDDGVLMATYLKQRFAETRPRTVADIRRTALDAARKRVRPAMMTTATTVLALLPVLTATGRGADVMLPMAIPSFGGMTLEMLTLFIVPTLYCLVEEKRLQRRNRAPKDRPVV